MSNTIKSPGQKRKRLLQIIIVVLSLMAIALVAKGKEILSKGAEKLIKSHEVVSAEITALDHETVKVRKRRRTKTKEVYSLSYTFTVDGEAFDKTLSISEEIFNRLDGQTNIVAWYASGNPQINSIEEDLRQKVAQNNMANHLVSSSIIVVPVAIVFYVILNFLFVRESKKIVPEGFVTDTSWLDVDDDFLVALTDKDVVVAKINEKRVAKVQSLYQNSGSLEDMLTAGKCSVESIPLAGIIKMESQHNEDTFTVYYGDNDSKSIEFLSPAVKEHALTRIVKAVPSDLTESTLHKTRLQSTLPSIISLIICGGLLWYFENIFVVLVAVLAGFFAVKGILVNLIDPAVVTTFSKVQVEQAPEEVQGPLATA